MKVIPGFVGGDSGTPIGPDTEIVAKNATFSEDVAANSVHAQGMTVESEDETDRTDINQAGTTIQRKNELGEVLSELQLWPDGLMLTDAGVVAAPVVTDLKALADASPTAEDPLAKISHLTATGVTVDDTDFGDLVTKPCETVQGALVDLTSHTHGAASVPTGTGFRHVTNGTEDAAAVSGELLSPQAITPGGKLTVPPAYTQVTGDAAVQLNSASILVAFGFTADVDWKLTALSLQLKAIAAAADITVGLYAAGTAPEYNGAYNGSITNLAPLMTADNAPSPYVVGLWDSAGNPSSTGGFTAYTGFRHDYNGFKSGAAPTGVAPIHLTIDLGANAFAMNKFSFMGTDAFPKAMTLWGSNVASPTKHTNDDWTQLTGGSWAAITNLSSGSARLTFTCQNVTSYRWYRWTFTDRNGAQAYVSVKYIWMYAANVQEAPGTSIGTLTTFASGSIATGWNRATFTGQQLTRKTRYWVRMSVPGGADISLSARAYNTAAGSDYPDGCCARISYDGGTSWTRIAQNGLEALINIVLQSTTNHASPLLYGRDSSDTVPVGGSTWATASIPIEGITCDCEALSVGTYYNAYVYDNAGTLTLEAVTTAFVTTYGLPTKSGSADRLLVGFLSPVNRNTTYQGVIDTPDARMTRNIYNQIEKVLRKDPGYYGNTSQSGYEIDWCTWNNNTDFKIQVVSLVETLILSVNLQVSGYGTKLGIGVDGLFPEKNAVCGNNPAPTITGSLSGTTFNVSVSPGVHSLYPLVGGGNIPGYLYSWVYCYSFGGVFYPTANFGGKLLC